MPDIRDIKDPEIFLPEPATPMWIWLLVALGVILLALALYFIFRKKEILPTPVSAMALAREELSQLKQAVPETPINKAATELSLTLRRYLSSTFHDPALFETNEEFTLRAGALPSLQESTRDQISQQLRELSQLKYIPSNSAKKRNHEELIHSQINEVEQLLNQLEIDVASPAAALK